MYISGIILYALVTKIPIVYGDLFYHFRSILFLICSVYGLSPVLRTITEPFSLDTINALTIMLFTIHFYFQDYAYVSGLSSRFKAPISLNAAFFGAVCLASQLSTDMHVFSIMYLAVVLFALFPKLRNTIQNYSKQFNWYFNSFLFFVTIALLWPISFMFTTIYIVTVLSITFICPSWLLFMQRYKNTINGPWDEAIPTRKHPNWKG